MAFNSLIFLIFFAFILALHSLPLRWEIKKTNLLLASYVFYAAWNPPFVLLLWISTLTDWYAARRMAMSDCRFKAATDPLRGLLYNPRLNAARCKIRR